MIDWATAERRGRRRAVRRLHAWPSCCGSAARWTRRPTLLGAARPVEAGPAGRARPAHRRHAARHGRAGPRRPGRRARPPGGGAALADERTASTAGPATRSARWRCAARSAATRSTAARLFGAAQATRSALRASPGVFGAYWAEQQAAVRAALGDAAFDAGVRRGGGPEPGGGGGGGARGRAPGSGRRLGALRGRTDGPIPVDPHHADHAPSGHPPTSIAPGGCWPAEL